MTPVIFFGQYKNTKMQGQVMKSMTGVKVAEPRVSSDKKKLEIVGKIIKHSDDDEEAVTHSKKTC
jgi:hypothetical protein